MIVKTGCGTDGALHSTNQDEEELFRHLNLSGVLAHENINRCSLVLVARNIVCFYILLIFLLRNPVPIDKVSTEEA